MNGISAAKLGECELEVDPNEFTETMGSINLHSKPLR